MTCEEKIAALSDIECDLELFLCELDTTVEFQNIMMENYNQLEPDERTARYVYHNSMTLGEVLTGRLQNEKKEANKIFDKFFKVLKDK